MIRSHDFVSLAVRSAAGTYIRVTWHIQQIAKRTMHVIIRHMSTGYCLVSYSSCCFAFLSILNPIYCTLTLCHSCVSNVLYARGVNTPVFCKSLCPISLCCWPFSLNKKSFVFNYKHLITATMHYKSLCHLLDLHTK